MLENDDDILLQEIASCQTNEDIQHLVDSQCLDIIGNSIQDQITLSHKQLFRVIRLFKENLSSKPLLPYDQRASSQKALAFQQQNCIMQYQLQIEQNRVNQLQLENEMMKLQLKIYEGDLEILKQKSTSQNSQINFVIQRFNDIKICVICMQKEYSMIMSPCGHICVCEDCSKQINHCPIDREKITKMKKVYLS